MLYAMNKWKRMILICLCPYAMRHANNVANATPRKGEELSPLEVFRHTDHAEVATLACFRLPHLCARQCTSKWTRHTQMETSLSTRGVP